MTWRMWATAFGNLDVRRLKAEDGITAKVVSIVARARVDSRGWMSRRLRAARESSCSGCEVGRYGEFAREAGTCCGLEVEGLRRLVLVDNTSSSSPSWWVAVRSGSEGTLGTESDWETDSGDEDRGTSSSSSSSYRSLTSSVNRLKMVNRLLNVPPGPRTLSSWKPLSSSCS